MPRKITNSVIEIEEIVPEQRRVRLLDANRLRTQRDGLKDRRQKLVADINAEIDAIDAQLAICKAAGAEPTAIVEPTPPGDTPPDGAPL